MPFSGAATAPTAACHDQANTWFWDQTLTETAGVAFTVTSVKTTVDAAAPNDVNPNVSIPANGSFTRHVAMCFPSATQPHAVQIDFRGTDAHGHALSFSAPIAALQPRN